MQKSFSKMRAFFWPVERHELIKVLPMALLMFSFLFNYTIMRDLKDTLILSSAGAEAIPFLKFWGTLPASILFVLIYAKASNLLKPKTLFFAVLTPFALFFTLFGFVLYPFIDQITGDLAGLQNALQSFPLAMQKTLGSLIAVLKVWPYALFYIMSELWGSMGVSLLFWQFANQIISTEEAKRFYPRFTQLGNLSLIFSGYAIIYFANLRHSLPEGVDAWGVTLKWLMGLVFLNCVIIFCAYSFMRNYMEKNEPEKLSVKKDKKLKLSIKESFFLLAKSPYLGLITMLVLAYGIGINLIEIVFKSQLKLLYPTEGALSAFLGKLSMCIGGATLIMVMASSFILNRISWRAAAFTTPLFLLITGGIFFSFVFYQRDMPLVFGISPLFLAVMIGAFQNAMSKGMKYALFDPTKEMAYIPLDPESKVKGKAAIDVIGGRLGKSGGGLILQVILLTGAVMDNLALIFLFVSVIVAAWLYAVFRLNRRYTALTQEVDNKELEKIT